MLSAINFFAGVEKMKRRRNSGSVNSYLLRRPIQHWFPVFLLPMVAAFCIGFV